MDGGNRLSVIEPKTELIDRVIRLAELALQAKDTPLFDELTIAIKRIQNPLLIANPQ